MKLLISLLFVALMAGCATPQTTLPENVSGAVCSSVSTLTTKVTTVIVNITSGKFEASPDCDIKITN